MSDTLLTVLVFVLFALPSIGAGLRTFFREREWRKTEGTVTGVEESLDVERMKVYAPHVEFRIDGTAHRFTSRVPGANRYRPGQPVRVAYKPSDPDRAHIDNLWIKYQSAIVLGLVALLCLAIYLFPAFGK